MTRMSSQLPNFSKDELLDANRELTTRLYELHNIFKISLDLTAIANIDKLQYTYLINLIGIIKSSGALLLLKDMETPDLLVPSFSRGYNIESFKNLKIDSSGFKNLKDSGHDGLSSTLLCLS